MGSLSIIGGFILTQSPRLSEKLEVACKTLYFRTQIESFKIGVNLKCDMLMLYYCTMENNDFSSILCMCTFLGKSLCTLGE